MKPRKVSIEWVDIAEHGGATWQSAKKVRPKPHKVETTCWLIYEDDDFIIGAMDLGADGRVSGIATYPRGCVRKVTELC